MEGAAARLSPFLLYLFSPFVERIVAVGRKPSSPHIERCYFFTMIKSILFLEKLHNNIFNNSFRIERNVEHYIYARQNIWNLFMMKTSELLTYQ